MEKELTKKARAGVQVTVWPSAFGGKNWEPMSFNPQTEIVYANTLNIGWNYKAVPSEYKVGEFYWGADLSLGWAWPDGPRGYRAGLELPQLFSGFGIERFKLPSQLPGKHQAASNRRFDRPPSFSEAYRPLGAVSVFTWGHSALSNGRSSPYRRRI
jgi:hypothetical protein